MIAGSGSNEVVFLPDCARRRLTFALQTLLKHLLRSPKSSLKLTYIPRTAINECEGNFAKVRAPTSLHAALTAMTPVVLLRALMSWNVFTDPGALCLPLADGGGNAGIYYITCTYVRL